MHSQREISPWRSQMNNRDAVCRLPGTCHCSTVCSTATAAASHRFLSRVETGKISEGQEEVTGNEHSVQSYCLHLQLGSMSCQNYDQQKRCGVSMRAVKEGSANYQRIKGFPDSDRKGKLNVGALGLHHRQRGRLSAATQTERESCFSETIHSA